MSAAALRRLESMAKDPVDPLAGEDTFLNGPLCCRALILNPACHRILAFGVLTNNEHIDICGGPARKRTTDTGHQLDGTHIGILVELPADRDPYTPPRDVL